jgi:hypothetical protein
MSDSAVLNARFYEAGYGCGVRRVPRRRQKHRSVASSFDPRAFRSSIETSRAACGFRAKLPARRTVSHLDVFGACSTILLIALIGSVLANVALAVLFAEVLATPGLRVIRRAMRSV